MDDDAPETAKNTSAQRESIAIAASIIDEVLDFGGQELYKHYLDERLSEFAVRMATEEMLEVVKWHFMSRDEGEGVLTEKASWQIDEEPEPAEIDSWARGALRTRKKPIASPPATGASAATDKEKSQRSRRSRRPSGDKPTTSGSGVESPTSAASRTVSTAAGGSKKKEKEVVKPPSAAERQRKLVEEAKAKRAAEAKAEQDHLNKVIGPLVKAGKEYTYDRNGSVVVIDEVDGSKLPNHSVMPGVNVRNAAQNDFTDEMMELKKVMSAARPTQSSGGEEAARAAALKRQQEQQPSLIESMAMVEGVTLMEGAKTKSGPQRKADASHMSLKDFQNYGGGPSTLSADTSAAPAAVVPEVPPPPPEPELELEPQYETEAATVGGVGDTIPLKDLPQPPKASQRQRQEQMGQDRLRLPRDRPFVRPDLPTRPIMPDKTSNLASVQDNSPARYPARLPPVEGDAKLIKTEHALPATNRLQTVDERLARQLLQQDR